MDRYICVGLAVYCLCLGQVAGAEEQVVGGYLDSGFTAIAAGYEHSLGMKKDGSISIEGKNISWCIKSRILFFWSRKNK